MILLYRRERGKYPMAKKELTPAQKAKKEIKRNHLLGWGLGVGGGAGLLTMGVFTVLKLINGTIGIDNSVLSILAEAGPFAGVALVAFGLTGLIIGSALANNEAHINKHLEKKKLKEEKSKTKVTSKDLAPVAVVEETVKPEKTKSVVTIKTFDGKVINEFYQVPPAEASYKDKKFSTENELKLILGNNMPKEDCIIEYNGETVAGYSHYTGPGTVQTINNENVKIYSTVVNDVIKAVYGKKVQATPVVGASETEEETL